MRIPDFTSPELCWVLKNISSRDDLLRELSDKIAAKNSGIQASDLFNALLERENRGSTATPEGVAFPHTVVEGLNQSIVAVGLLEQPVNFSETDDAPCNILFLLLGPPGSEWDHLRLLAHIARICRKPNALANLRCATDADDLYERIQSEDGHHA
jgi:PTS system nitrogen regulatory IIA component